MFSVFNIILNLCILKTVSCQVQEREPDTGTRVVVNKIGSPQSMSSKYFERIGDGPKEKFYEMDKVAFSNEARELDPKLTKPKLTKKLNEPDGLKEIEPGNAALNNKNNYDTYVRKEYDIRPKAEKTTVKPRTDSIEEPNTKMKKKHVVWLREKSAEMHSTNDNNPEERISSDSKQFNPMFLHTEAHLNPQERSSLNWPMGVVPYYINRTVIDGVTIGRITKSMELIESLSCLLFTEVKQSNGRGHGAWMHITNTNNERECVHSTPDDPNPYDEIVVVIGIDCIRPEEILHTLLHGIGLQDEVTHPHRDQYIRVLWENIQPKYRPLYGIRHTDPPHKLAEYDPASIMHFHDRAFSANGGATIASLFPGLTITPSRTLSQLDIMKLELAFGHGCKKRQVSGLFDTCKNALPSGSSNSDNIESDTDCNRSSEAVSTDHEGTGHDSDDRTRLNAPYSLEESAKISADEKHSNDETAEPLKHDDADDEIDR